MGGHDQSDPSFLDRSRDAAIVVDVLGANWKNGIPHLHSVHRHWHYTTSGKIATWMDT